MWAAAVVQGYSQATVTATLPFTREALGLTEGQASAVLAVTRLAALGAILFSWWADHRGRRRPLLAAFALMVVGAGATAFAAGAWPFALSQSLVRACSGAVAALGIVWLAERLDPARRALGLSLFGAASSFGAGLALLSLPVAETDPRLPYLVSLLGLLLVPLMAKHVEETAPFGPEHRGQHRLATLVARPWRGRLLLLGAAAFLAASFTSVGIAFSTERLVNQMGLPTGTAAVLSLAAGTVGAVGLFVGGRLADTWGRRPTSAVALLVSAVAGVAFYRAGSLPLVVAALTVSALATFAYVPAFGAHRSELFPTTIRATAGTTAHTAGTLGSAAGLAFGSLVIDHWGLGATMSALAFACVAGAVLTLFLPETRGKDLASV
jgi:predicted MFS family arabinose efflux permease